MCVLGHSMDVKCLALSAGRPDHLMLFIKHVSRMTAGNGRVVLERVGPDAPTIAACFTANPQKENAVQEGLVKWCGARGTQLPHGQCWSLPWGMQGLPSRKLQHSSSQMHFGSSECVSVQSFMWLLTVHTSNGGLALQYHD